MMSSDEAVSIKDLTARLLVLIKNFDGKPWNIMQNFTNIRMVEYCR